MLQGSWEVALTAKVPYDMGPNDCNEFFKTTDGETRRCNRPKGHAEEHRQWIGDRVMYYEAGHLEKCVITKRLGEKRF